MRKYKGQLAGSTVMPIFQKLFWELRAIYLSAGVYFDNEVYQKEQSCLLDGLEGKSSYHKLTRPARKKYDNKKSMTKYRGLCKNIIKRTHWI